MPRGSKRSRSAKEKYSREQAVFVKHSRSLPSLVDSEDEVLNYITDTTTGSETCDEDERSDNEASSGPIEAVQRLYAVFLPPHLRLEESTRHKRQKLANRSAVYRGNSQTTKWRRRTEWAKAAEGCRTLDAFFMKVRFLEVKVISLIAHSNQKRKRSLSIEDLDEPASQAACPEVRGSAAPSDLESETAGQSTVYPQASSQPRDRSGEALVQSMEDLAMYHPDSAIDDAVDNLASELAAFCLKSLEGPEIEDRAESIVDPEVFETELQVNIAAQLRFEVIIEM